METLTKIEKISIAMRKLRVVSISALTFTLYMTWEFIQWIMTSDPASLGEAAAVTGVSGSLVALVKFIFEFAATNESRDR